MKIKFKYAIRIRTWNDNAGFSYKAACAACKCCQGERGKGISLNIGQPDVPTPREGIAALESIDRSILEYSPSEGLLSLRQKLCQYYKKFSIDVDVDDIIVTTGGSEAVLFAFMACLDPGDEIIVPEPAYANYMAFAISAGAKIITVPSSIDEGFALPPVEKFEELITSRTKGILICNPNNPTGYLYTMKEMLQIRDLVKKHDLFLFPTRCIVNSVIPGLRIYRLFICRILKIRWC